MNNGAREGQGRGERQAFAAAGSILLVEDNNDDVELTLRALKRNGINNRVVTMRDGAQALDYLLRRGAFEHTDDAAPALILLDLKLPKVDGLEVLDHIKSNPKLKVVPVVMLTSSRQEHDVFQAYTLGVNSYICKPTNFSDFIEVIKNIGRYWFGTVDLPPQLAARNGDPGSI